MLEVFLNRDVANENDMLTFGKLINGIALLCIPNDYYGTAFIADVPEVGACLMSAGHNFESLLENMSTDKTMAELGRFKIWFGNVEGEFPNDEQTNELKKGKAMNLKLFLETLGCCGSISYRGKRVTFKYGPNGIETKYQRHSNTEEDYCAIWLSSVNKEMLSKYGLDLLQCGDRQQIKHQSGSVATLVGHPGHQGWTTAWPRRLGYGKEVGETDESLQFDYDSLGGNSGSPVFGRGYRVKGIHVRGSNIGRKNYAQKIDKIKDWINLGK